MNPQTTQTPVMTPKCGKSATVTRAKGPYTLLCGLPPEHEEKFCLDFDGVTKFRSTSSK